MTRLLACVEDGFGVACGSFDGGETKRFSFSASSGVASSGDEPTLCNDTRLEIEERDEERVGERLDVLIEAEEDEDGELRFVGRAGQQGPDVDGVTYVETSNERPLAIGDMVSVEVVATDGIDLVAEVR